MIENKITTEIAEIILDVVNNPAHPGRKDLICADYHISRGMLTPQKLLRISSITFFRLMLAIADNASEKEYNHMLDRLKMKTLTIAKLDDGTNEAIKDAHAGSPIGKKREKNPKAN